MTRGHLGRLLVAGSLAFPAMLASADFSGYYAPANWTVSTTGTPPGGGTTIDASGAPDSITILGGDSEDGCLDFIDGGTCEFDLTIKAPSDGQVNFSWSYQTIDEGGPEYDQFSFWLNLNGTLIQLSDDDGSTSQAGSETFDVEEGQVFGFHFDCTDCVLGVANIEISDFDAPQPQPVPTMPLPLLGALLGLVGLLGRQKLKPRR